jgi:hypothetical protein
MSARHRVTSADHDWMVGADSAFRSFDADTTCASHPLDDVLRHGAETGKRRDRWDGYRAGLVARAGGRFTPPDRCS